MPIWPSTKLAPGRKRPSPLQGWPRELVACFFKPRFTVKSFRVPFALSLRFGHSSIASFSSESRTEERHIPSLMPQQTESATRTRLCRINDRAIDEKVRVAGRVLHYEPQSAILTLIDGHQGLLVDTSIALNSQSGLWATERLSTIIVVGRIERVEKSIDLPPKPNTIPYLYISPRLVLRAIMIAPSPDLDLELWNRVLEEAEHEHEEDSTATT